MIFILAGNAKQAEECAHRHRLGVKGRDWRYAALASDLNGSRGGSMIVTGLFWDRKDAREIHDVAVNNHLTTHRT